ncbi:unnamed protein product, partial [marine sediment metagenome]
DDEDQRKYIEHYIFDGVWLTYIDYQIKQVKQYQQAEQIFDSALVGFKLGGLAGQLL